MQSIHSASFATVEGKKPHKSLRFFAPAPMLDGFSMYCTCVGGSWLALGGVWVSQGPANGRGTPSGANWRDSLWCRIRGRRIPPQHTTTTAQTTTTALAMAAAVDVMRTQPIGRCTRRGAWHRAGMAQGRRGAGQAWHTKLGMAQGGWGTGGRVRHRRSGMEDMYTYASCWHGRHAQGCFMLPSNHV